MCGWLISKDNKSFVHTAYFPLLVFIAPSRKFKVIFFFLFRELQLQWSLSWWVKCKYSNKILNIFEVYAQLDKYLSHFYCSIASLTVWCQLAIMKIMELNHDGLPWKLTHWVSYWLNACCWRTYKVY